MIPDTSHLPFFEQPEAYEAAVLRFVRASEQRRMPS